MSNKPGVPAPVVSGPVMDISDVGSAHAPILYFDEAPAFGHSNGVFRIALAAARIYPGPMAGDVRLDHVIVAHLRMNLSAALALRNAINGALLLAAPADSKNRN